LDLIHYGPGLSEKGGGRLFSAIREWLSSQGTIDENKADLVQFMRLRRWGSGIHLLQCTIPAASLVLTATGFIAPWGDIVMNNMPLELYTPEPLLWEWNPQFQCGTAGLAHAILIGLNLGLIRANLHLLFKEESASKVIDSLEEYSTANMAHVKTSDPHLLFGRTRPHAPDRLTKRLMRAKSLLERLRKAAKRPELTVEVLKEIEQRYNSLAQTL